MATEVNTDSFQSEVLDASGVVLVDFFAPWCGPCQALLPVIEELSSEISGDSKVVKVNVDEAPELAAKYGVVSIPSIKIFKAGEVVDEAMGVQPKEALKAMIEKHV